MVSVAISWSNCLQHSIVGTEHFQKFCCKIMSADFQMQIWCSKAKRLVLINKYSHLWNDWVWVYLSEFHLHTFSCVNARSCLPIRNHFHQSLRDCWPTSPNKGVIVWWVSDWWICLLSSVKLPVVVRCRTFCLCYDNCKIKGCVCFPVSLPFGFCACATVLKP